VKKTLAVLVFILVAACLIAPKFIAPKHQETVVGLVGKINKTPGYSAKIISTDLAWFGSENKVLFTLDMAQVDPSLQAQNIDIELVLDTHYGPLLFSNQGLFGLYATTIKIEGNEQRKVLNWDESTPLYQLSVLGRFMGNINVADKVPPFSNMDNTFQFSGYSGQGELASSGFSYEGNLESIHVVDAYSPLKAEGFYVSVELNASLETIMQGGFYDSTTDFSLNTLSMGTDTQLSGLNIEMGSNLNPVTHLGHLEVSYLINEIISGSFKANDLILITELDNLNNQFFIDYKNFFDTFSTENPSFDETYETLLVFMQENLDELLAAKPEFNIPKLSASFPEGRFNATLTSTLADISTPTIEALTTPEFWLYNTIVKAEIEADQRLVSKLTERFIASQMRAPLNAPEVKQQALMLVEGLVKQGFIRLENTKYKSEIRIENGQGKVFDLSFPLM
jgi:hypothetical protein